jgi:hypothetical protein
MSFFYISDFDKLLRVFKKTLPDELQDNPGCRPTGMRQGKLRQEFHRDSYAL